MKKNKCITLALCATIALSLTACGAGTADDKTSNDSGAISYIGLPNPWVECETMEEAAELAGFDMTVPDTMDSFADQVIRVLDKEMIEVIYRNNETDENEIRIRKGTGSEDISGDYSQYGETNTVTVGDLQVTMKGADGQVSIATWIHNGYAYSIGINGGNAPGISNADMSALIASVE